MVMRVAAVAVLHCCEDRGAELTSALTMQTEVSAFVTRHSRADSAAFPETEQKNPGR